MGNFKFGDHATKDFDLVIQEPPAYNFPEKDLTTEHIPGRNGDLIIDNNCWKNVERTYSVASVFKPGTDFVSNSERLIKWLTSYKGYHRLEDSYDPEVFRIAQYKNGGSLVNFYDKATVLNVTFDCKPQRYLKNGEKPVHFTGSVATLENPTGYAALPEISISGMVPHDNEVLLVTIKNLEDNKVTSIVTLNKIITEEESYDVVLNSELQTVYSTQIGDVNAYVNLNETEFPKLYKGKTRVSVNTYIEDSGIIESYNSLIDRTVVGSNVCLAKYKPFDSVVESKQKSIYAMSYDLLKQKLQEVYEMKAYANYCLEKAETFIFKSFNTVLAETSASFSFQDDFSAFPEWLDITRDNSGQIIIKVGDLDHLADYNKHYGYFLTSNAGSDSDKKIMKLASGAVISNKVKNSSTVTINFYPADSSGNLAVDYSNEGIPSWLGFEIVPESNGSPKEIKFKHIQNGYYYLPKSGLFGKAKWARYMQSGELNSLTWSTSKKAFMPSGISTSTTAAFQYYFLPYPYSVDETYLQYEPVYQPVLDENGQVKKDANGNPITKISNDVYFKVTPLNEDLTLIKLEASVAGYFRLNDEPQGSSWRDANVGTQIATNVKSTSSLLVYYLKDIPTYESIDGWPEWLYPEVVKYDSNHQVTTSINPKYIDFRVKQSGWYMFTYEIEDGTRNTCWVYRNADELLGTINGSSDVIYPVDPTYIFDEDRSNENNTTIYMLEGESSEFPVKKYVYEDSDHTTIDNIGLFYIDNNGEEQEYPNNQPPSWLKIKIVPGTEEDGSDTTLDFFPQQTGLYKWDEKTVWETKQSSDTQSLVTSKITDDTSLYFMSSIPEYPTSGTIYNKCSVEVNTNKATGNPESISVFAKEEGYYKPKNNSSWKYYNVGDEICNSTISEMTDINYLTETSEELSNIEISVIPRWWSL